MNNKRGGAGAKILLVLILMIASAVGGAYGYRVLDGQLAARDAMKAVEDVDVSDYDTPEQSIIQGFITDATKDLETAKTRKEVYEILADFIADVEKVQTKRDKELEQALREAEEAKKRYNEQNNSNNSTDSYNQDNSNGTDNTGTVGNDTEESGGYKSNDLSGGDEESEKEKGGLINSLLGGMSSGADGN